MILYERDGVKVSAEMNGAKIRVAVEGAGEVPFRHFDTAYPLPLIKKLIDVKGPVWFADEIARDEDAAYVQRTIKWGTLPFVESSDLQNARILDFGCGSGASTAILGRTYPNAEIIGVELDSLLLDIANDRAQFYGLSNVRLLTSPSPDRLPDGIGSFDFINLSAVLEHLLPDERKVLLPMLWSHLRPGGTLFIYETPHRFFPIEGHTTGLPFINYLPSRLAHAVIDRAAPAQYRKLTWPQLLRMGVRGGSITEVMKIFGESGRLVSPSRMGVKDRLHLWYLKASEGRRPQRTKDLVYKVLKAVRTVTGVEVLPELTLAVRKTQ